MSQYSHEALGLLLNLCLLSYVPLIFRHQLSRMRFFPFFYRKLGILITDINSKHNMGCFTVLKSKKKRAEQPVYVKRINPKEHTPTTLPEPKIETRSLQSAPPSFRTRVKPIQQVSRVTNSRTRALSAPSTLDAAEQDALSSMDYEEAEEPKYRTVSTKEQRPPSPQPLPLPSPQGFTAPLRSMGSFKSITASGPLHSAEPLPLPPTVTLRNFSYDEIASACLHFSSDRCVSEGLSSVIYRASFGDDTSSLKRFEATVTRLHPSTQVT